MATGSASLTSKNGTLGAAVDIAVANTWYDGPPVSLEAGTWFVDAFGELDGDTAAAAWLGQLRITDGTTHYASGEIRLDGNTANKATIAVSARIVLAATTTIKIQATASQAGVNLNAATVLNGSGNNACQINAIKVA